MKVYSHPIIPIIMLLNKHVSLIKMQLIIKMQNQKQKPQSQKKSVDKANTKADDTLYSSF